MYRAFELKSDVDRLYLPREQGGRGLISVWDAFQATTSRIAHSITHTDNALLMHCVDVEAKCLYSNITRANKYESNHPIELPKNFKDRSVMVQARMKAKAVRDALHKARAHSYLSKPQHSALIHLLQDSEADIKQSMAWLKRCHLSPHVESYICGAQELALITKFHEKHILKNNDDDRCRICKKDQKTVFHILGACDVLAKREYFTRHNNVCRYIHYKVSQHYGIPVGNNWFNHNPADVSRSDKCEIIYDQTITTSRPVGANRPDIIIKDKVHKKAYILDVSCPVDTNVGKKEQEKLSKYGPLRVELERMWGVNAETIPIVIGGLGTVTKNLHDGLTKIPGCPDQFMCQKICLLGSKRILQDVLRRR